MTRRFLHLVAVLIIAGCSSYTIVHKHDDPKEVTQTPAPPVAPVAPSATPVEPTLPMAMATVLVVSKGTATGTMGAGRPPSSTPAITPIHPPVSPPVVSRDTVRDPEKVYRQGEKLTFDVKWYAVTAGEATMEIGPHEMQGGESSWHFITRAYSTLLFFFKVNDRIESWASRSRLLPLRFEKHLHEGSHTKDLAMTFDRPKAQAVYFWRDKEKRDHNYPYPLGPDCRDLLGAFYWFRTMDLPPVGQEVNLCVHTDKTNFQLAVSVLGRETVKVPAGEFKTILIKPRLTFEGLFNQQGDVKIWLTDDETRIPVLVQSKVRLLGSVNIVLRKLERP